MGGRRESIRGNADQSPGVSGSLFRLRNYEIEDAGLGKGVCHMETFTWNEPVRKELWESSQVNYILGLQEMVGVKFKRKEGGDSQGGRQTPFDKVGRLSTIHSNKVLNVGSYGSTWLYKNEKRKKLGKGVEKLHL